LACDAANCDAQMYIGYTYLITNDTAQIRLAIPSLKRAYECRLAKGERNCGENIKQNALWLAEAYLAIRDLEQAVKWSQKVLACDPSHKRAGEIKKQAESEY
jgi:tetratricopeptide (TPR) repeat protein